MVHELKAKLRKEKEADRLLAVVYGPEIKENKLISLHPVEFGKLYEAAGESSIINLAIEGEAKSREVLIKAVDYTPVRDIIRHVDFYQIKAGQKLEVEVELNFVDESSAVKDLGGILVTNMDKLKIRCLAKDMISELKVSLSALKALNVACDYFSLALAIFGDYACALRLAYFLHYDLLCRLCGDTAEFLTRLKREGNLLVQHRVFFNASSVFDHDVLFRIETRTVIVVIYGFLVFAAHQRVVHHYFCLPEFHVASLRIECRADYLPTLAVFAAIRCGKRGF